MSITSSSHSPSSHIVQFVFHSTLSAPFLFSKSRAISIVRPSLTTQRIYFRCQPRSSFCINAKHSPLGPFVKLSTLRFQQKHEQQDLYFIKHPHLPPHRNFFLLLLPANPVLFIASLSMTSGRIHFRCQRISCFLHGQPQ